MHNHTPIWSKPLTYDGDFRRLEAWLNGHRAHGSRRAIIITNGKVRQQDIPRYIITQSSLDNTFLVET